MNKIILGIIIFIAVVIVLSIIFGLVIFSQRNTAVAMEERVQAQYKANQSNYDNMWKRFKEMTQVTELQADQFKEVYQGLITGRYEDPKLLFKMVQEQNPQLNTEVYIKLQNEISAGRQQFDNNQKQLLDIIREYNTYVRQKILMPLITGRKRIDENQYIITSDKTNDAFEKKMDDEIKLK